MRTSLVLIGSLLAASSLASAADGLISVASSHSVKDTADRLENVLKKGLFTKSGGSHSPADTLRV